MNESKSWVEKHKISAWIDDAHRKLDERETDEVEVDVIRDAPSEEAVAQLCKKIQSMDLGFLKWSYRRSWTGFTIHAEK